MGIAYDEEQKVFGPHTKSTTYLCGLTEDGYRACELHYEKYEIRDGKPKLEGLPAWIWIMRILKC